jgi:hypothetical protein
MQECVGIFLRKISLEGAYILRRLTFFCVIDHLSLVYSRTEGT